MIRARPLQIGLVGLSLMSLVGMTSAQGTAPAAPPSAAAPAPTPPSSPVVKRTVLPDGTVLLDYADGTNRRVAPEAPSKAPASSPSASDPLSPAAPPEWLEDPATNQAFLAAMGEYYRYRSSGLRHRSRVFEWQLVSSKVIFTTVLMLVSAGMVFAAIQFRVGLKGPQGDKADAPPTQIDLSATGVKVSSPVLGVIILVISLAFFYLYLVYVYPISEIV